MRSSLRALEPWLALVMLCVLFELPGLLLAEPMRPTAELPLILAVYVAASRPGKSKRWLNALLLACALVLTLYNVDRALFVLFLQQERPLYDQLFMVRLLFVLFTDLWTWKVVLGSIAVVLAIFLLVRLSRILLARGRELATAPAQRRALLALALLICASTVIPAWLPPPVARHLPRWVTPALLANIDQSRALYARVQQQLSRSVYDFDRLRLQRKPDIYLFIVESYGRVLWTREALRPTWLAELQRAEGSLSKLGWHSASAFSTAPISGGGSWLADATFQTGIHIDTESVFHHVIGQMEGVPNLVRLLSGQGYHTVQLGPSDRKRPGVGESNYYGYAQQVGFKELRYTGPKLGWGIVPDQYSLAFTHEHVLRQARRPLLLNFHMVSSHTPWEDIPALVDDWRTLNQAAGERDASGLGNATLRRLGAFAPKAPTVAAERDLSTRVLQGYEQTVRYDLRLLERYLGGLQGDVLVLVMGDHQPPLIAGHDFGRDTPIHLFARDPALLEEFKAHGFKQGLALGEHDRAAVCHEGMFSLIARALATARGDGGFVPAYRPNGVRL